MLPATEYTIQKVLQKMFSELFSLVDHFQNFTGSGELLLYDMHDREAGEKGVVGKEGGEERSGRRGTAHRPPHSQKIFLLKTDFQ